jgi:hypothetical protein
VSHERGSITGQQVLAVTNADDQRRPRRAPTMTSGVRADNRDATCRPIREGC